MTAQPQKHIPAEERIDELFALFQAGRTAPEIAKETGVPEHDVQALIALFSRLQTLQNDFRPSESIVQTIFDTLETDRVTKSDVDRSLEQDKGRSFIHNLTHTMQQYRQLLIPVGAFALVLVIGTFLLNGRTAPSPDSVALAPIAEEDVFLADSIAADFAAIESFLLEGEDDLSVALALAEIDTVLDDMLLPDAQVSLSVQEDVNVAVPELDVDELTAEFNDIFDGADFDALFTEDIELIELDNALANI